MWFSWNKVAVIFGFCDTIVYSSANLSKFLFIILSIFYLLHFCIYFIFFRDICCGIIYFTLLINLYYTKFPFHVSLNFAQFCLITSLHLFEEVLSFSWLKVRQNVFVLISARFLLLNTFDTKILRRSAENPSIKRLHVCYFYFATLWLGALYNFGMWLDELFLKSWHHNR